MKYINIGQGRKAIVDDEDYEYLIKLRWSVGCYETASNVIYRVFTTTKRCPITHKTIKNRSMASIILDTPQGMHADHQNNDPFDNRRKNLRVATPQQNQFNTGPSKRGSSKYKGVSWNKDLKKWRAGISINGKQIYLGYYQDEKEAARVYNEKAQELFGEFAYLNVIEEDPAND